jgi:hypothetical protein
VSLSVRLAASEADIPAELWAACFPPPMEGRWWYRTLETSGLEDQFAFLYAVISEGDRPVGIAPAFIGTAPIALAVPPALKSSFAFGAKFVPSLLRPRTLFVGSPCADEGTVGLLAGVDRRRALEAVQHALGGEMRRRRLHMIAWKDFPDSYAEDLAWLAERHGLFRMMSFPGSIAALGGTRKADYFAALKGSRRGQLKKKLRSSTALVDVDVDVIQRPSSVVLDEIFGLFRQTSERGTTSFERLNRRFFAVIAEAPVAHFVVIREKPSGAMLAFMLCFDMGGRIINKFIGIDHARPREWRLYFRLWDAVVDWALSRGAAEIQSGQTGYAAKIETGHRLIPLTNYGRHRLALVHRIYSSIVKTISWETLDDDLAVFLKAHPRATLQ